MKALIKNVQLKKYNVFIEVETQTAKDLKKGQGERLICSFNLLKSYDTEILKKVMKESLGTPIEAATWGEAIKSYVAHDTATLLIVDFPINHFKLNVA